jgi:hypothetical protein
VELKNPFCVCACACKVVKNYMKLKTTFNGNLLKKNFSEKSNLYRDTWNEYVYHRGAALNCLKRKERKVNSKSVSVSKFFET